MNRTIQYLGMCRILRFAFVLLVASTSLACASDLSTTRPAHHTDDGFKNLHTGPITKGPFGYLKMRYFGDDEFADHAAVADQMDVAAPDYEGLLTPDAAPQITWLGHSTFLLQYKGVNILTDPMLSDRASPISFAGPKRLVPKPVSFEHLPDVHYLVISHNHYDHLDLKTLRTLSDSIEIYAPLKLGAWLIDQGFDETRVHELDWWDSITTKMHGTTVTLSALPAQHWSARGLFDRNETLWASWMLDMDDYRVWFGGDTGYNKVEFKEIGLAYPNIDLALIPIGAYAPRWFMKQQHTDPYDAVEVHLDLGAKKSIGMHWGTFELSAEPMFEPKTALQKAVKQRGLSSAVFDTMAIGETRRLALD